MQALQIADIADVNVQPGVLMARLLYLKRLIQNAGISDLLDVNVNPDVISKQLAAIRLPVLGETMPVGGGVVGSSSQGGADAALVAATLGLAHVTDAMIAGTYALIPATYDLAQETESLISATNRLTAATLAEVHGGQGGTTTTGIGSEGGLSNLAAAQEGFNALGLSLDEVTAKMKIADVQSFLLGTALDVAMTEAIAFGKAIDNAHYDAIQINDALDKTKGNTYGLNTAMLAGIPLIENWGVGWGRLTGKTQLFAGVLTGMGIPAILGTAGAIHVAVDASAELLAVIIPATVGIIAFGAAAAPTIGDLYSRLTGVFNVSRALNSTIYPMSGDFVKLANAVQPEVYQLFGQALVVMNNKLGAFKTLAVGAGSAIDQLGARAAAAISSGGLDKFLANAKTDILGIGNVFGNVFGIIGNVLHVLPGYANVLLSAIEGLTGGLEHLTANSVVQWGLGATLAFHGALLWAGLAATAVIGLGNAMVGLAAKFGIVDAEATFFNGAQFGAGLKVMLGGVLNLATSLFGLRDAEMAAAAGAQVMTGADVALDAVSPFAWVALAVAGLGGLVYVLTHAGSATKNFVNSVQGALTNVAIGSLGGFLTSETDTAIHAITTAQRQLNSLAKSPQYGANSSDLGLMQQAQQQAQILNQNKALLPVLAQDTSNWNTAMAAAGGNLSLLNAAGISSSQILSANKNQLAQYTIEIKAAGDAVQALALGTGRNAAALNAETNLYLTENIPALQSLTQAEDNVLSVITAGPTAFVTYAQGLSTLTGEIKTTGGVLGGLHAAGLQVTSDFYTELGNAQKLSDAMTVQGASTGILTSAVATMGKELLSTAGNNLEAKGILVDYINNALGPGTVSLQSITGWVQKYGGSLGTLNGDQAKAAEGAGILAGVLNTDVRNSLSGSALVASGFQANLQKLQTAMENHAAPSALQSDAQLVYNSLIHAGVGATTAKGDVDSYFKQLGLIPPTITTNVVANTKAANTAITNAEAFLNSLNGRTATMYVNTISEVYTYQHNVLGKAGGGIIGAAGGGVRSGLTLVGENGPEVAMLPVGSTVRSHADSMGMMGGSGGGPIQIIVSYDGSTVRGLSPDMIKRLRYTVVTTGGGDVQQAFGRNGA